MDKYKIFVNLPNKTLIFRVENYETKETGHYIFLDKKTGTKRKYDSRICEIIEDFEE